MIVKFSGKKYWKVQSKSYWRHTINNIPQKSNTVDYNVFREAVTIYGYFYREDTQSDWIHDGMIEEWKFENLEDAERALIEIQRIGYDLYFNTESYYLQKNNYLYLFHTRAAAFNLTLKKFYKEFKMIKLLNS